MATVNVNGGAYIANAYDDYISCGTGSGPCWIVLPSVSVVADGKTVTVVDAGANAGTSNILIRCADGSLINGSAVFTISLNSGSVVLTKQGQGWSAAGSYNGSSLLTQPVYQYATVSSNTFSTYTVKVSDSIVGCNVTGTLAITLPPTTSAGLVYGRPLIITDQSGNANLTSRAIYLVAAQASTSINGGAGSLTISSAFGSLKLYPTSTGWWSF